MRLVFDNRYSRLRGKTVRYRVELGRPGREGDPATLTLQQLVTSLRHGPHLETGE